MGLEERANRILTTHVGSLPWPDALSAMMTDGKIATKAFDIAVRDAVDAVVRLGEIPEPGRRGPDHALEPLSSGVEARRG